MSAGSPLSKAGPQLAALAQQIAGAGTERVAAALDGALLGRAEQFLAGLETYRRHPYRRAPDEGRPLWQQGSTRLLDYGGRGAAVVLIPSLINRHYILDLLPERSFVRFLRRSGRRVLVVDWGAPGDAEAGFGLDDYIAGRLGAALGAARAAAGKPVALAGYCMGGLLALAAAQRRPHDVAGLALLATPWDFHAERPEQARLIATLIERAVAGASQLPLWVIQSLFLTLDPFLGERKFVRFAGLDPASAAARDFVALEDWLNDGVPLAAGVARGCGGGWYRDNDPPAGLWRVAGRPVVAQAWDKPALVVVPARDRIVPPRSAEALGRALPNATVLRPPLGHIGMMASAAAPEAVWRPIAAWLRDCLGRRLA